MRFLHKHSNIEEGFLLGEGIRRDLADILKSNKIRLEEPLSRHTTFRIGGSADYFVTPENVAELSAVTTLCKESETPFIILGNGSNILAADEGYHGAVIQLKEWQEPIHIEEEAEGTLLVATAGIMLSKIAMEAAKQGLTGMEFAAGIPGTLGGAVVMNAGAYGGEIKENLIYAEVLDKNGRRKIVSKDELELGYRTSSILKQQSIVLRAAFRLQRGVSKDIYGKIEEYAGLRKEKQPLEYPSAGSTFKRPPNHFAGQLIMDSGMKGFRIGGAMVSEKHCGFIINVGDAQASDVIRVIEEVKRAVLEQFGVLLEPEVKLVGF